MPRLRQERQAPSSVPVELLHRDEPLWRDVEASRGWFERHGLTPGLTFHVGPACRRQEAIVRWLLANGYGNPRYPKLPDWHRLADLQIEGGWQSDASGERLARVRA